MLEFSNNISLSTQIEYISNNVNLIKQIEYISNNISSNSQSLTGLTITNRYEYANMAGMLSICHANIVHLGVNMVRTLIYWFYWIYKKGANMVHTSFFMVYNV